MNVLLIEGNAAVRDSLQLILEDMGHTVHWECCTEVGLAFLRETTSTHVVIVSNQTPYNLALAAFFQKIIADPALKHAHRYVALTTSPATLTPEALVALQTLHATLICKPFNIEELLATVID